MATHRLREALGHLQQMLTLAGDGAPTDGQLLARFVAGRDEAAFAALVRRHGPLVLGVCRRVLRHAQDAEDAFQATFLVLARKAASVRKREAVGSWLYGVAYRTALEARCLNARRWARERQVAEMPEREVEAREAPDWRPLLDHELSQLPEWLRAPLVLCDLQGQSRKDAARQLRLPEGTLSSRLARGRALLARRLARYGLSLTGGALAGLLAEGTAAAVPAPLVLSTTKAAVLTAAGSATLAGVASAKVVALTEGVLKAMLFVKLKTATAVLAGLTALGLGTGGLLYQARVVASDPSGLGQAQAGGQRLQGQKPDRPRDGSGQASQERRELERQEMRLQLERARRELDALRAQAEEQQQRAEAERRRADEAIAQLKKALDAERVARQQAARRDYVAAVQQAQQQFDKAKFTGPGPQHPATTNLDQKRAVLLSDFERRRAELLDRVRQLEQEQRKVLEALDRQRTELSPERRQPPANAGRAQDPLERVLQRLERIEQRLDRLERN
jgi:RNA polymerase sigma factor (sigma-70 family)